MPRPRSSRTFRFADGHLGVYLSAEGRLSDAYFTHVSPADGRDLAHEILAWVIGERGAATYAPAFRDEVLATLPTEWELTEREILSWLQTRQNPIAQR